MLIEIVIAIVLKLLGSDFYEVSGAMVGALFAMVYTTPAWTFKFMDHFANHKKKTGSAERKAIVVSERTLVQIAKQAGKSVRGVRLVGFGVGWFVGHSVSAWLNTGMVS